MRNHFLLATTVLLALTACRREDQQIAATFDPDRDTATVDTAPGRLASGVAVLLTGSNIIALLDTGYAAAEEKARLARQRGASAETRAFAEQAAARHRSARLEIAAVAARHSISPLLPEQDLLEEQREAMEELRRVSGAEFDRVFVERSIRTHEALLRQIDDALDTRGTEPVADFLRAQREKIVTERDALRSLRVQ